MVLTYLLIRRSLLPSNSEEKAFHRPWIEFASQTLDVIARYYCAEESERFYEVKAQLRNRFERLEQEVEGPYFSGSKFMIVDAAYAPVFRYFDVFEALIPIDLFDGLEKTNVWRKNLAARNSVKEAVADDFHRELIDFVVPKKSHLGRLLEAG